MRFQNPANGYVDNCSVPFLWALIFGPLYFVLKGIWRHVVLYFVVNMVLIWLSLALASGSGLIATFVLSQFATQPAVAQNTALIAISVMVMALIAPFLIYPFIAGGIVRRHYMRMGWNQVE